MQRYKLIEYILEEWKPGSILEVGTWNGVRASRMLEASKASMYYGFDLFEDATKEDDQREFNVKKHYSLSEVSNFLNSKGFENRHKLFKGNSTETLPKFIEEHGEDVADFAFIDGGHSVETIRSDWECVKRIVKKDGLVIFDDFYKGRDSSNVGCNEVVKDLEYGILTQADPVVGGGTVNLVLVRNHK